MNHRLPNPFGRIESSQTATRLGHYSVAGFLLWAGVLVMQAGLVWTGAGSEPAEFRASTTGFASLSAILAGGAALVQWRRPNRVLPVFGLAWSLYETSALVVGLLVGMPMAMGGLPDWATGITAAAMVVCAMLHVGGLRGAVATGRDINRI